MLYSGAAWALTASRATGRNMSHDRQRIDYLRQVKAEIYAALDVGIDGKGSGAKFRVPVVPQILSHQRKLHAFGQLFGHAHLRAHVAV